MPLINQNGIINDTYTRLDNISNAPESGAVLVNFDYWQANQDDLRSKFSQIGIIVTVDDDIDVLINQLEEFSCIALHFNVYADGRHYSNARLLKSRHGYQGELRACGEVLRDQLNYMARCGFDTFEVADEKFNNDIFNAFSEFSVRYQN